MSDRRKFQNPSEYGKWHEISLEDIEQDETPARNVLKPLEKRELSTGSEHGNEGKGVLPKTFSEDETLEGLDQVISNLKQKAASKSETTPSGSDSDTVPGYLDELDDIGTSVLQGMSAADFLDELEKELEMNIHEDNSHKDDPNET